MATRNVSEPEPAIPAEPGGDRAAYLLAMLEGRRRSDIIRNRILGVLAMLGAIAALKIGYPVAMPLAAACFVIAVAWPMKRFCDRALPGFLSSMLTALAVSLVFLAAVGVAGYALRDAMDTLAERNEAVRGLVDRYSLLADHYGLPELDSARVYDALVATAELTATRAWSGLGYLGLIAILVFLGLPAVPVLSRRLRATLDADEGRDAAEVVHAIAEKSRRYVLMSVVTSVMTGVASAAWAWAMGLDLVIIWGILNFVLNFVPVIGNIIGILPPTLYAFVQYGDWQTTLIVFGGFAVLQIAISNFIYPALQGQEMSMPAVAIVAALTFWGWAWGLAGALLAIPLTATFLIVCGQFRSLRWLPRIVLGAPEAR